MAAVIDGVPVAIPPPKNYKVDFDNPQRNSVTEAYWLFGAGNLLSVLFISHNGLSDPNAPPTIGAIPTNGRLRHDHYERFDEDPMYPLQTISVAERSKMDNAKGEEIHEVISQDTRHSQDDCDSERAIMRTQTTTVSYSS